MYAEPRNDRSRSSPSSRQKHRSRSRVRVSRDAAAQILFEREQERERRKPLEYDEQYTLSDVLSERSAYSDALRYAEIEEARGVMDRVIENHDSRESRNKYMYGIPVSPDLRERSSTRSYDGESHDSIPWRRDESLEKPTGASFSIGLGKHNLSGGIHFGKSHHEKRSSYNDAKSSSGSKPKIDDNLAYGSFDENHLAYPDPPRSSKYAQPVPPLYTQPNEQILYTGLKYHNPHHHSHSSSAGQINYDSILREPSPDRESLSHRINALNISVGHKRVKSTHLDISNASGSPLLEPYQGTYQTISPMPSPTPSSVQLISPTYLEPLSPNSSAEGQGSRRGRSSSRRRSTSKKPYRKARFHDPEEEASLLAQALSGDDRPPDTAPLISILPGLTHAQVLELRSQYKKLVKTGSERKDVNIAKHIKLRLKSQPDFMRACYTCALGRWESEAYWVNVWCRGETSRKELLIESLMGRTNEEIRAIKNGFRNKRYDNDLVKCMRKELSDDKFKKAIMLVLEEKRMEERLDGFIDYNLVDTDVKELRKAIKSQRGGESAVIEIVVLRSQTHLKEVLKAYRHTHGSNFAKAILKKSGNLVGELLAHILNGVINMPVRDALLLHHALFLSHSDPLRIDLMISRLVRYHWDRPHLELVRTEFRYRYENELQMAVAAAVAGDLSAFLEALCVRRIEDDVRVL